jgi:hypothetical protein
MNIQLTYECISVYIDTINIKLKNKYPINDLSLLIYILCKDIILTIDLYLYCLTLEMNNIQ